MSDEPLPPLVSADLMPDILAGVNVILRENSSEAQDFITNNSRDIISESSTMQNENLIATAPRPRRLPHSQLKLPVLSSSSSDSDGDDISRPPVGGDGFSTDNGNRTASPPPNCAICLSRCKNKCFTDSCMHQFCFKCLCEWSKVKPECPLCKQTFKSIIHNVKSIDQFEEYHVQAPTVELPAPSFDLESFGLLSYGNRYVIVPPHLDFPRNRSSMVFTSDPSSSSSRSNENSGNPFDTARVTRAYPIALLDDYYRRHPDSIGDEGISHLWRTYIYDRKLYALPVCDITGRFRESSARFYRDNPAQVHRLMPWIRRDIDCLVDGVLIQRDDVIQSIAEALTLMNILSSAFRRRIQPYLGTKTAHFIHELNNFARSPYDMIGYDRTVRYSPQIQEEVVVEFSLSESSDTEDNATTDVRNRTTVASTSTSTITSESQAIVNAINLSIHDRVNVANNVRNVGRRPGTNGGIIELGDESDNNNDPTASTSRLEIFQQQQQQPLQPFQGTNNEQFLISRPPPITDNIELSSASSDCEFVLERKPPHLRTPEMVSLDSATDSDVMFVDEVKPLNKISFNTTDDEEEIVNKENAHIVGTSLTNITAMGVNDTSVSADGTGTCGNPEIASSSTYRNKNKQQHHSQNGAAHHCKEIYNVGASTSSGLRSTASMRSKRDRLVQHEMYNMRYNQRQRERCSRRDSGTTATKNETFRRLRRNESRRLEKSFNSPENSTISTTSSESSVSSPSFTSVTKIFPFSTTTDSSSLLSTTSSDEDFQPPFARKRRNNNKSSKQRSASVIEKRPTKRNIRKRRMVKRKFRRGSGRIGIDEVMKKINNKCSKLFTDDSETNGNGNSDHDDNYSLAMALRDKLKEEQKQAQTQTQRQETNKKERSRTKRQRSFSVEQTDVENAWRSEAVNEPLKKQQRRQARNSYKMTHRQQETQSDVLNNQRNKVSTVMNVIGNSATNSNASNEQSTSRSPTYRETSKHNYQRKQDKQEQQQQSQLGKKPIKREYISDDDDDDDDDIDNLYLSVLKSILKAERSTSLGEDVKPPSNEMVTNENGTRSDIEDGNGNRPDDQVETQPEVHPENEMIPPPILTISSSQIPLRRLFEDNERDESDSMNTTASSVPATIGDIEMPRPGANDTNEVVLNVRCCQHDLAGGETIVAPVLNRNTILITRPPSATETRGTLEITVTSSSINENSNDVHIRVNDNININPIHNNNDSNNNDSIIVRNNNQEFSALSSSPSASSLISSLSSSSTVYEVQCPEDRILEKSYLHHYRNRQHLNYDPNNDYNHNNDENRDRNDDDDDNHSNSSTISTDSISSTATTDTASDTTENDLNGVFH